MESLNAEAASTFWFLSRNEFELGSANIAEMEERWAILEWLSDPAGGSVPADPRGLNEASETERPRPESVGTPSPTSDGTGAHPSGASPTPPDWIEFIPSGLGFRWCFTKNDEDSYPSVPHGHLNIKTNPWPKLNPYTGRAFSKKDTEIDRYRLSRKDMITLWNDRDFRRHALETIVWYSQEHSYYRFPVADPLRLPIWKRR